MMWASNHKPGPCYSNVSLIKRSLFQSNLGTLPLDEIVLFLQKHWHDKTETRDEIYSLVERALYAPKSFFQQDENELWSIKKFKDSALDDIYNFVQNKNAPFRVTDILRAFKHMGINPNELAGSLASDIRFSQVDGSLYWLLSEWDLINDLVYEFMQRMKIKDAKLKEILAVVQDEYQLQDLKIIFAPEIDERFNVKRGIIEIELEEINETYKEIIVPVEVTEEVARNSLKIMGWIESQQFKFRTRECVSAIFRIKAADSSFQIYYQALENFFISIGNLRRIESESWVTIDKVPELDLEKIKLPSYQVHNSKPTIPDNLSKTREIESDPESEDEETSIIQRGPSGKSETANYGYCTVSYHERIKGYLRLPGVIADYFSEGLGKVVFFIEEMEYNCWFSEQDNSFYLYGEGILDFYSDYLIEPGSRIKISALSVNKILFHYMGMDSQYALEQSRFLDIGKLADESRAVNKSIFTIMCEVLATYPSGMHWTTLLDKVNELRVTTKNTVYNLLAKNECFNKVPNKQGYWQIDIQKLSRYYIDEEDYRQERSISKGDINCGLAKKPIEIEVNIGHIASGKKFILSFTDENKRLIDLGSFVLQPYTFTNGEKDNYYNFSHHWDLRHGQEIMELSKTHGELISYEVWKDLFNSNSALEYTNFIRYKTYLLIKSGAFSDETIKENGEKVIHKVSWIGEEIKPPDTFFEIGKEKKVRNPYDIDEEYELPPHNKTFFEWAKKQRSIRYDKALSIAEDQKNLIDILTNSYSRLLCKFAQSRSCYSLEYMDIVQEGFFGLLAAIRGYDNRHSFAHYTRLRINQKVSRFRNEQRTIIRIPTHMVESLKKLEKLITISLLETGQEPNLERILSKGINSGAINIIDLYTNDYISFEQYWGYLESNYSEVRSNYDLFFFYPWTIGKYINNDLYNVCLEKTEEQIDAEMELLMQAEEQDSDFLWSDIDVEKEICQNDLKEIVLKSLDSLTDREMNVVKLRFGFEDGRERTLEEVGRVFGVTRERIRQIEAKSFRKLKPVLKKAGLAMYLSN